MKFNKYFFIFFLVCFFYCICYYRRANNLMLYFHLGISIQYESTPLFLRNRPSPRSIFNLKN